MSSIEETIMKVCGKSPAKKYMVRFWSDDITYAVFSDCCKRNGLPIGKTLHAFMVWYNERYGPVETVSSLPPAITQTKTGWGIG